MRLDQFRIVFVGAGRVAWHLGKALLHADYQIMGIHSRNLHSAQEVLKYWGLTDDFYMASPQFTALKPDIVFLTVPDNALLNIELELPSDCLLVHTSGSMPLSVLNRLHPQNAVFYPLQTFSKEKPVNFSQLPICVEASTKKYADLLLNLASKLGSEGCMVSSEQRRHLHLGAVWACNFVNHCWTVANQILQDQGFELKLLHGLIEETWQKAQVMAPHLAQTGPALRGDTETIKKHLEMLTQKPLQAQIYEMMSQSIEQLNKNK